MTRSNRFCGVVAALSVVAGCNLSSEPPEEPPVDVESIRSELGLSSFFNTGTRSLHLERNLRFASARPGADPDNGRVLFGLGPDLETIDTSGGLFEGPSIAFEGVVVSNGRACSSCHRGKSLSFGMPPPPLTDHIALTDPALAEFDADAQGDPDAFDVLVNKGLFKYRANRFNPARPQEDPYRRVFFWRKSPALTNVVFSRGFLLDGRARVMFETARGAVFSHTQTSDQRFDDLFTLPDAFDMEAFMFAQLSDPRLAALLDKNHPDHDTLASDPFHTVELTTRAQRRGKRVFIRDCMSCHNTPNVFNDLANVQGLGADRNRSPNFPAFGPNNGRAFNVGVAEQNAQNLRFTEPVSGGGFVPVVVPLVNEDGTVNEHTVTFDIGLAATTGRTRDIGRFKVPQLRNIKNLGPYFHNNSAATLEDVVDYFNSDAYNRSADGRRNRIRQSPRERRDLVKFLEAL